MILNKNTLILPFTILSLLCSTLFGDDMYKQESLDNGKLIYESTCISCHGAKGETSSAIFLIVKPRKLNKTILSQEQSFKIIKDGAHYWGAHSDIMPTFKYVYNDDEISDVALYISEEFNSHRDKKVLKLLQESDAVSKDEQVKMLSVGEKIFKRNCSTCHGVIGDGKSEYVEKLKVSKDFLFPYNLTRTLLNEDEIFLYAKFGGHYWGTDKNDMPSWQNKYNDFKLKSVAKYVNEKIKKIK